MDERGNFLEARPSLPVLYALPINKNSKERNCAALLQLVDERGNFREDNFDKMRAVRC